MKPLFNIRRRRKRSISRNIIEVDYPVENSNFDLTTRISIRKYFDLYQPYSMKDADLVKHEKEGLKQGELSKGRKFYFIAKGGGGSVFAILVPIEHEEKAFWCAIKTYPVKKFLLEEKNVMDPKFKEWRELVILKECSQLVLSMKTQNLPISYGFRVYTKFDIPHIFLYSELEYANLENWIKEEHIESEWKSFFFQFWFALYSLQKRLKLVHNDLRLPNVLYHKVKSGGYWKYTIEGEEYYVPNHGDVFIIWDFGSSEASTISKPKDVIFHNDKLKGNTDLIYIHSLYQRIRVLALETMYTLEELKQFFDTPKRKAVYDKEYQINKSRFDERRFPQKFKMALIYYLLENGMFEQVYNAKIKKGDKAEFSLPPDTINSMLKQLNDKDNMTYKEVSMLYKRPPKVMRNIDPPQKLISRYLSEFKIKQEFTDSFEV